VGKRYYRKKIFRKELVRRRGLHGKKKRIRKMYETRLLELIGGGELKKEIEKGDAGRGGKSPTKTRHGQRKKTKN